MKVFQAEGLSPPTKGQVPPALTSEVEVHKPGFLSPQVGYLQGTPRLLSRGTPGHRVAGVLRAWRPHTSQARGITSYTVDLLPSLCLSCSWGPRTKRSAWCPLPITPGASGGK